MRESGQEVGSSGGQWVAYTPKGLRFLNEEAGKWNGCSTDKQGWYVFYF